MRRSWPLWCSETVEAARNPVLAVVPVCKYTSTLTQTQRDLQHYIFHQAKSLLKMFASKQAKNVVRIYWQVISLAEASPGEKQSSKCKMYFVLKYATFVNSSVQVCKRLLGKSLLHFVFSDGTIMYMIFPAGILPVYISLFGLASPDLSFWYPPSYMFNTEEILEVHFRVRYVKSRKK